MSEAAVVDSNELDIFCLNNADEIRDGVRQYMLKMHDEAIDGRRRAEARRINRALSNERIFNRIVSRVERDAIPQFMAESQSNPSLQADGELIKWLVEWFSNGGWETIIKFIEKLLPLLIGASFQAFCVPEGDDSTVFGEVVTGTS